MARLADFVRNKWGFAKLLGEIDPAGALKALEIGAVSIKDAHGQYLAAFRQQRLDGKGAVQTLDELYEVAAAVLTPFKALVNQIAAAEQPRAQVAIIIE